MLYYNRDAEGLPRGWIARMKRTIRTLDGDLVLLEYSLSDERSWVWAITRDAVVAVPLASRAEIERAANHTRALGWEPIVAEHAGARRGYFAGSGRVIHPR